MVNECLKGTSIRRVISTRDNLLSIISDDVEKFLLVEKTHPSIDSFLLSTKLLLLYYLRSTCTHFSFLSRRFDTVWHSFVNTDQLSLPLLKTRSFAESTRSRREQVPTRPRIHSLKGKSRCLPCTGSISRSLGKGRCSPSSG